MTTIEDLKLYFETGDQPTEEQFIELVDACYNEVQLSIAEGSNLFNIADPNNVSGQFVNPASGALVNNASHFATSFIEVQGGVKYYFSDVDRLAWYDADQGFISGEDTPTGSELLTSPDNARFLRISQPNPFTHSRWTTLIISPIHSEATSVDFSPYDGPYFPQFPASAIPQLESLIETTSNLSSVASVSSNLFNNNDPSIGIEQFVSHLTGALGNNVLYNASHFIKVTPNSDLYVSSNHRYAWYDENQQFISGSNLGLSNIVIQSPANARYFRLSYLRTRHDVLMIAESSVAVPFQPFGVMLDSPIIQQNYNDVLHMVANGTSRRSWSVPTNCVAIGDSFWNDGTDIAARAAFHSGIPINRELSIAGALLEQIPGNIQNPPSGGAPFDFDPFDTVIIGRATNDTAAAGQPFEEVQRRLMHIIGLFPDKQLVITTLPPLDNRPDYSPAMQSVIDRINDWLAGLFVNNNSRRVFDSYSILADANDELLDIYENAPGDIHPNDAGYDAAGQALATLLTTP